MLLLTVFEKQETRIMQKFLSNCNHGKNLKERSIRFIMNGSLNNCVEAVQEVHDNNHDNT